MIKSIGHLMVDLETLGVSNNSVICSIGIVEFDMKSGKTGNVFYNRVNIQSCIDLGMSVTGSTIEWWLKQDLEARRKIYEGDSLSIRETLFRLNEFLSFFEDLSDIQIWGNSNRFDLGILENTYKVCNIPIPWNYRNERDVRTLSSLRPEIKKNSNNTGIPHDPISDCLFQIKYCCLVYNELNKGYVNTCKHENNPFCLTCDK